MGIKYGDLPSELVLRKLLMLSFDSPSKNLSVYRFINSIMEHVRFLQNERDKLIESCCNPVAGKPGMFTTTDIFKEKMQEILDLEVVGSNPIPVPDLSEDDFTDSRCQYPAEKELWMNGREITTILSFLKNIKK